MGSLKLSLLLVPASLQMEVMHAYNDPPQSGHLSQAKTLQCLSVSGRATIGTALEVIFASKSYNALYAKVKQLQIIKQGHLWAAYTLKYLDPFPPQAPETSTFSSSWTSLLGGVKAISVPDQVAERMPKC